jgi:hypothetical protein
VALAFLAMEIRADQREELREAGIPHEVPKWSLPAQGAFAS